MRANSTRAIMLIYSHYIYSQRRFFFHQSHADPTVHCFHNTPLTSTVHPFLAPTSDKSPVFSAFWHWRLNAPPDIVLAARNMRTRALAPLCRRLH